MKRVIIVLNDVFISTVGGYYVGGKVIHGCFHCFNAQIMIIVGYGDDRWIAVASIQQIYRCLHREEEFKYRISFCNGTICWIILFKGRFFIVIVGQKNT